MIQSLSHERSWEGECIDLASDVMLAHTHTHTNSSSALLWWHSEHNTKPE